MKRNSCGPRTRRALLAALLAAFGLALLFQAGPALQSGPVRAKTAAAAAQDDFKVTTVFLVRHAERDSAPPQDPALSEAGKARSQELARLLSKSGIRYIYTTQFMRTKQTAEPLSKQLGVALTPVNVKISPSNPRAVAEDSIKEFVNKIYERGGEPALIIGHTNTVPEIIRMLGGDAESIDEKSYDDLFIVTVYGKGKAQVVRLKYGSSS